MLLLSSIYVFGLQNGVISLIIGLYSYTRVGIYIYADSSIFMAVSHFNANTFSEGLEPCEKMKITAEIVRSTTVASYPHPHPLTVVEPTPIRILH